MAGLAHSVRALIIWRWITGSPWFGDQVVNTLHFDYRDVDDQPGVGAGPITLADFNVDDATGSFSHTTAGMTWTVERGWSVSGASDWDGVYKGVLNAWHAFYTATTGRMAGDVELDSIRFYAIGDLGKNVALAPAIARPTASLSPAATSQHSPGDCVVLSLYSALRSKRGRGRFYFGPLDGNFPQTTTGLINTSAITTLGAAMQAMMVSLRDVESGVPVGTHGTLTPVILHRAPPYNLASVIQKVRVGDELDHQERREKKRAEAYTDFAVT